eukprot:1156805-Pelagomonas_calceolata.AAC.1
MTKDGTVVRKDLMARDGQWRAGADGFLVTNHLKPNTSIAMLCSTEHRHSALHRGVPKLGKSKADVILLLGLTPFPSQHGGCCVTVLHSHSRRNRCNRVCPNCIHQRCSADIAQRLVLQWCCSVCSGTAVLQHGHPTLAVAVLQRGHAWISPLEISFLNSSSALAFSRDHCGCNQIMSSSGC